MMAATILVWWRQITWLPRLKLNIVFELLKMAKSKSQQEDGKLSVKALLRFSCQATSLSYWILNPEFTYPEITWKCIKNWKSQPHTTFFVLLCRNLFARAISLWRGAPRADWSRSTLAGMRSRPSSTSSSTRSSLWAELPEYSKPSSSLHSFHTNRWVTILH